MELVPEEKLAATKDWGGLGQELASLGNYITTLNTNINNKF